MSADGAEPDDELYIGYLVSDVSRLMRTVFDRRVRKLGLTRAQWLLLTRLYRRPGSSQSDLADMLEIEKASAGRLIDRLELKGWVERRPDPNDRRIKRMYLTDYAERVHASIWPVAEATVSDATSNLSERELVLLADLMGRVKSRLQVMCDESPPVDNEAAQDGAEAV